MFYLLHSGGKRKKSALDNNFRACIYALNNFPRNFRLKKFPKKNTDFFSLCASYFTYYLLLFSDFGPLWNLGGTLREEKFTPGLVKVGVVVTL